jgi:hypothetical protein
VRKTTGMGGLEPSWVEGEEISPERGRRGKVRGGGEQGEGGGGAEWLTLARGISAEGGGAHRCRRSGLLGRAAVERRGCGLRNARRGRERERERSVGGRE